MKKYIKGALYILVAIALLIAAQLVVSPRRRPSSSVRNHVLRQVPIGTRIEDVIAFAEDRRGWVIRGVNPDDGFLHPAPLRVGLPAGLHIIGEQSMIVDWGRYRTWYKFLFIVPTHVSILFGFDTDGYLIEVFVWKIYDIL